MNDYSKRNCSAQVNYTVPLLKFSANGFNECMTIEFMEHISLKWSPLPPHWSKTSAVVNLPALTGGPALWSRWPPLTSLNAVSQSEKGDIRCKSCHNGKGIYTACKFSKSPPRNQTCKYGHANLTTSVRVNSWCEGDTLWSQCTH